MRTLPRWYLTALAVCASITFGAGTAGAQTAPQIGAVTPPPRANLSAQSLNDACVEVSKNLTPTVVSISVGIRKMDEKRWQAFEEFYSPFMSSKRAKRFRRRSNGSGVIISDNGYIITNNHVVDDAEEDSIMVTLPDGKIYWAALVGQDQLTDLAVLRIYARSLPTAYLANSDSVKVGQWVLAIGNPLSLSSTVTAGIVSAVSRTQFDQDEDESDAAKSYIQTDAAINPGNSGGGLFNLNGELVGINSMSWTGTGYFVGYGFAIPSNIVRSVAQDLIELGKVARGQMGIFGEEIDETNMRQLKLDSAVGLRIVSVDSGGPGERSGLKASDVILAVDSMSIKSIASFKAAMSMKHPGSTVRLLVSREGKRFEKDVVLAKEKAEPDDDRTKNERASIDIVATGDADRSGDGITIGSVTRYGAAEKAGLLAGDVIQSLDGKPCITVAQLESILGQHKPGDVVTVGYRRSGSSMTAEMVLQRSRSGRH